jgi:hypothetical protein
MVHHWLKTTEGSGAAVCVVLFDYEKAFDLNDHNLLVQKIFNLSIHCGVTYWPVINFLTNRKQCIKLAIDCYSEWVRYLRQPLGLVIHDVNKWKDVDDTIAEIVPRNNNSDAQNAINDVDDWSLTEGEFDATQLMGMNKCKELQTDFKLIRHSFKSLSVNGLDLSVVESVKI